ncbi:deoxyribonuclease IV [Campylobacter ureolyticus]|uniref:Probable endonuclease 4 n=1 Tax=Campylobacter ureolyticus TaxID=827 RepID=A0A9Q4KQD5_9BACT|nr:deoxyribonuclease IV [Campylobacter ureolyticus]MCZ6104358.1 deoxyribonuclease IV [Campylobacter ureolyticus]MCZ6133659.1 deoxyribonuclease IV [Campylobacter ureolyticus]MCZ6162360.1 deoxyribonuclease IV [Campylobacter ureolyticus]MCZ6171405.1 deoxyribonuclease IV [Campylobacter ureolyticus]MDU4981773.1 deoxyribonuclease IV [Campylobacter ureolyticus]
MKRIGAHVSAAGGVENAPLNAFEIGADAFALFVKNQRQWSAKALEIESINKFDENLKLANIKKEHVLPHNSYLINLGHPDAEKRKKSINAFIDEIQRANLLGLKMINFHPGSHLREISENECLENISNSINFIIANTSNVKLVIENTAGQGSNLGYKLENLAYLIDKTQNKQRVGVCIDTCHFFAGGYDLRSKESYKKTMSEFDKLVGYKYLSGMHLNDSKNSLGIKKDRHESIGKGTIGLEAFENIMRDENIDEIPLILETINPEIWADEIKLLRQMC